MKSYKYRGTGDGGSFTGTIEAETIEEAARKIKMRHLGYRSLEVEEVGWNGEA